ncbi:class II SORL domain-containing protein [Magnetofaba australis]|uniref:Putative desulfoferrodoxin, ferrous iron-binding region n=1 Tax=Magnetofaba australis IT-1 TaxID=1434232 RepID=A0A1Y2K2K0_9PROT|nr:class II SORL domain-containing protein [Magnetofaba australis]OSM02233.1 putative desulfoferrodoxin, ferrous iron-binding region [Magnetofaba australis IT-1]
MPKINRYVDISEVEKEAKKDYIDRHSPFIECADSAKAGEKFPVTVRMGKEYAHPDDTDHYIKSIQLYSGTTLLGEANFVSGMLGGTGAKGQAEVTFNVVPSAGTLRLTALSYCTKHGLWECDPVEVNVAE